MTRSRSSRGENDALEHSHHLCEARRTLAVNKDLLTFFARCQQLDRNIMGSVAFLQRDPASGHILIPCDDLFILRGAVAAAKGAVVNRFQQICFPASVRAEQQVDPRAHFQLQLLIIPKHLHSNLPNNQNHLFTWDKHEGGVAREAASLREAPPSRSLPEEMSSGRFWGERPLL